MFQLYRDMDRLDLPAGEVFQLQKSLNRIQVALPGFPSQEAEAYLALFTARQGVRAAIAFHLQSSQSLAIYLNEPGPVAPPNATRLLDEGIAFAESMGFMLGDLDLPLLSDSEKATLWERLPLREGLRPEPGVAVVAAEPAPEKAIPAAATPSPKEPAAAPRKAAPSREKTAPAELREKLPSVAAPASERELKPAFPAGKKPEPAPEVPIPRTLRAKKRPPTVEEMAAKRQKLREAVGKVLASL